jgi:hypothetical protein
MVLWGPVRTISLKLPDEIDARLEARAREVGRTKSEITREALLGLLDGTPKPGLSCLDLVRDLVGVARGPGDLASNPKHLSQFGRETAGHRRHRADRRPAR